jgi:hypothetical protein
MIKLCACEQRRKWPQYESVYLVDRRDVLTALPLQIPEVEKGAA